MFDRSLASVRRFSERFLGAKAFAAAPEAVVPPPPRVVFLHIPKTGGITFRKRLIERFHEGFHNCEDPQLAAVERALARFPCVELHTITTADDWYILHAELLRQSRLDLLEGRHVFTMLRDPVDHFVSSYYYLQTIRAAAEPAMRAHGLRFPERIEELLPHPASFNEQVAFLAGKSQRTGVCVDRGDLEDAKRMLLRLKAHVGILERFDESMRVFEVTVCGGAASASYGVENRNPARPTLSELPATIADRIRDGSYLDRELYEFGNALLDEDLRRVRAVEAG